MPHCKIINWYLNTKRLEQCEGCLQTQKEVYYEGMKEEPKFFILEFILRDDTGFRSLNNFCFNQEVQNQIIKTKYQLVATINHPTENHFNCFIFESY